MRFCATGSWFRYCILVFAVCLVITLSSSQAPAQGEGRVAAEPGLDCCVSTPELLALKRDALSAKRSFNADVLRIRLYLDDLDRALARAFQLPAAARAYLLRPIRRRLEALEQLAANAQAACDRLDALIASGGTRAEVAAGLQQFGEDFNSFLSAAGELFTQLKRLGQGADLFRDMLTARGAFPPHLFRLALLGSWLSSDRTVPGARTLARGLAAPCHEYVLCLRLITLCGVTDDEAARRAAVTIADEYWRRYCIRFVVCDAFALDPATTLTFPDPDNPTNTITLPLSDFCDAQGKMDITGGANNSVVRFGNPQRQVTLQQFLNALAAASNEVPPPATWQGPQCVNIYYLMAENWELAGRGDGATNATAANARRGRDLIINFGDPGGAQAEGTTLGHELGHVLLGGGEVHVMDDEHDLMSPSGLVVNPNDGLQQEELDVLEDPMVVSESDAETAQNVIQRESNRAPARAAVNEAERVTPATPNDAVSGRLLEHEAATGTQLDALNVRLARAEDQVEEFSAALDSAHTACDPGIAAFDREVTECILPAWLAGQAILLLEEAYRARPRNDALVRQRQEQLHDVLDIDITDPRTMTGRALDKLNDTYDCLPPGGPKNRRADRQATELLLQGIQAFIADNPNLSVAEAVRTFWLYRNPDVKRCVDRIEELETLIDRTTTDQVNLEAEKEATESEAQSGRNDLIGQYQQ